MKKKIFAAATALLLMMSGALCGCSLFKEDIDSSDSEEPVETTDTTTDIDDSDVSDDRDDNEDSNDESSVETTTDSELLFDKESLFRKYLEEQERCTISENFKIIEPGTARDNPSGLAGAVKYDFDNDNSDELVTFTFEKNDTDGDDIRIDLLEVKGGRVKVEDSKYLTELLDMEFADSSHNHKGNTIYYSSRAELQLVQSEYNGQFYFGVLLKEAPVLGAISDFDTRYSVFTIKDKKIESEAIGAAVEMEFFNLSYAKQIPSSMGDIKLSDTACIIDEEISKYPEWSLEASEKGKAYIDEITVDKGKYNLFTDYSNGSCVFHIIGGAYESMPLGLSAMLNDFGLDFESQGMGQYDFISKDQSEMKMLIQMEQVKSVDEREYVGTKLTLNSDLEKILGNDNNNSTDDIEKVQSEWQKAYIEKLNEFSGDSSEFTEAALLYIDDDDIPEIYIQNYSYKRDAGFIYSYKNGEVYEMGRICGLRMCVGGYKEKGNMYYSDFSENTGNIEGHEFYKVENGYGVFITAIKHDIVEDKYYIDNDEVNEETYNKKFEELKQGINSKAEILSYDEIIKVLNGENVNKEPAVQQDEAWRNAYLSSIDDIKEELKFSESGDSDFEYALMYIDDDNIPEFLVRDKYYSTSNLYTYYNGNKVLVSHSESYINNRFTGYIKNKGIFLTYDSGTIYFIGYGVNQLSDGSASIIETLIYKGSPTEDVYTINDKKVTEKEWNDKLKEYENQYTEITYYTEDEIVKVLNGEEVDKQPTTTQSAETNETSGNTATVKADGGLNMRKSPDKEGEKITLIPNGSTVEVIEVDGEWSKVKYESNTGWVKNSYLR